MASSSGGRGSSVQLAAPVQHGISNCREKLTQCQQQRLGGRHLEGRPVAGEQPTFKDAGFVRADRLLERIGYGALQPSIVLHWNKVRVIRPEPGQHVGMNVAVEVVHQERAEDRNVNLLGKLIEQVLEVHAGGDVPALPQDIDHFSPHPHFGVAPSSARLSDDVGEDAWEYSRIRHAVPHEAGQEFLGVNHHQLSAFLCRLHIDALGLEAWAEGIPVGERRHQYDALSVRETSAGKPADGAAEKILVLIELHDVIAGGGVRHHSIPGLTFPHPVRFMVKVTVHGNCLRSKNGPAGRAGPYHTRRTANAGLPQYPWGDATSLSIILWCRCARRGTPPSIRPGSSGLLPPTDGNVSPIPSYNRFALHGLV